MNIDGNLIMQYIFYLGLVCVAGAGEYLHLVPVGTLIGILGLVTGHFFGNGTTKTAIAQITTAINKSTVVPATTTEVTVTSTPLPLKEPA